MPSFGATQGATLKLLNKKNTFTKIWREPEIITIFAVLNKSKNAKHAQTYRIAQRF
jgi:hypothetical protein